VEQLVDGFMIRRVWYEHLFFLLFYLFFFSSLNK